MQVLAESMAHCQGLSVCEPQRVWGEAVLGNPLSEAHKRFELNSVVAGASKGLSAGSNGVRLSMPVNLWRRQGCFMERTGVLHMADNSSSRGKDFWRDTKTSTRRDCGACAALSHDTSKLSSQGATAPPKELKPSPSRGDAYFASDTRPVVLFDGVCNLCNKWVNFLLDWDPEGQLRFAALQSEPGRALISRAGRSPDDPADIVLVEKNRAYFGADAIIHMAQRLKAPFPALATAAHVVPGPLKDAIYHTVSEHRYQIFGTVDACRLGNKDFHDRFLNTSEAPES